MSDNPIPIGPIVGAAVGLGILGATLGITKKYFDQAKEEKVPARKNPVIKPITSGTQRGSWDVDRSIEKMLTRRN